MFDHLISLSFDPSVVGDFTPLKDAPPSGVIAAQLATANWLEEMGVPSDEEIDQKQQQRAAREAFTSLALGEDADPQVRERLAKLKTPPAVQQLAGMLCAYDWEFIEQAKELRGYTVAKIVEETKHPDARIRLKALQMLGNVTEVALFTERVEVKKIDASEAEIEARLRERLTKYLRPAEVEDAEIVPVLEPKLLPEQQKVSKTEVLEGASDEIERSALDAEISAIAEVK